MTLLISILSVYEMILLARFIISFFITSQWMYHPVYQVLRMITEPYLALFRFRFLRYGFWDFSPILAIWFLGLIQALLLGQITSVGVLLIFILLGLWEFTRLMGIVLLLVLVFRSIAATFFRQSYPSINYAFIDGILSRISFGLTRLFIRRGFMSYTQSLGWAALILLLLGFLLNTVVAYAVFWLQRLPF